MNNDQTVETVLDQANLNQTSVPITPDMITAETEEVATRYVEKQFSDSQTQINTEEITKLKSDVENASNVIKTLLGMVQNIVGNSLKLFVEAQQDYVKVVKTSQQFVTNVSNQVSTIQTTIKATPRFRKIVGVGLKMIASYRISEIKRANLTPEAAQTELDAIHEINAQRLYDLCIDLRGGVLKIGQFISCRQDLLPQAYIDALSALQDKVPAIPTNVIIERVEQELGPIDSVFKSFDKKPVAAASLAQVHKAVLLSGEEVAVKVRVPGIEDIVDIDLTAAKSLSLLLRDMLPQLDLPTIFDELKRSVGEELDYRIEASNMENFRREHGHNTKIIIPTVSHQHSTDKVLVMEFIQGEKLTDYLNNATSAGDKQAVNNLLETLIDSFCSQIMEHGTFHADPHPGNFLVTKDHKLAILDFGSVRSFDQPERVAYSQLTTAIVMQDTNKVVELLKAMHFNTKNGNPDTLIEFSEAFLGIFRESMGNDISGIDPRQQMSELMTAIKNDPVVDVPGNFIMLGRVFAYLSGLIFFYKPEIFLFNILSGYVAMESEAA